MEHKVSRRDFMKGAAVLTAAVAVSGLTGCSGTGASGVVLGDYRVDVDMAQSILRKDKKDGKETCTLLPVVYITNLTGSSVELRFNGSQFSADLSDGSKLTFDNALQPVVLAQNVPMPVKPSFTTTDMTKYDKLNNGELTMRLTVTLSGQKATFYLNFKTLERTIA